MNGDAPATAQLIMKREDGTSLLDLTEERLTAASPALAKADVSDARAADIRKRLEALGFTVAAGNLNTLSLTGPPELFAEQFGFDPHAAQEANVAAHAKSIPPELQDFVADVFVTPGPEFFP